MKEEFLYRQEVKVMLTYDKHLISRCMILITRRLGVTRKKAPNIDYSNGIFDPLKTDTSN